MQRCEGNVVWAEKDISRESESECVCVHLKALELADLFGQRFHDVVSDIELAQNDEVSDGRGKRREEIVGQVEDAQLVQLADVEGHFDDAVRAEVDLAQARHVGQTPRTDRKPSIAEQEDLGALGLFFGFVNRVYVQRCHQLPAARQPRTATGASLRAAEAGRGMRRG
jgi:hypothetical protein